jgi:hypothetical protein
MSMGGHEEEGTHVNISVPLLSDEFASNKE